MIEDDIIVYVRKAYGNLEALAIVQGNVVARFNAPVSDDARDRRSDVAELASRAYDAAQSFVRSNARLASTHTGDPIGAADNQMRVDEAEHVVRKLAEIHQCDPDQIRRALGEMERKIARAEPPATAGKAPPPALSKEGQKTFDRLLRDFASRPTEK